MMVAILKDEDWHKLNINNKPTAQSNNRELMWHQVTSNKELIKRVKEEINTISNKKDDEAIPVSHLETRSSMEEDNTWDCKTNDVDNYADTDALSLTAIDGRRNPQDCSGQANMAEKEDTNKCVLPVDSKSKKLCEKHDAYYDDEKDIWLEGTCDNKFCPFCPNRPTKPSEATD